MRTGATRSGLRHRLRRLRGRGPTPQIRSTEPEIRSKFEAPSTETQNDRSIRWPACRLPVAGTAECHSALRMKGLDCGGPGAYRNAGAMARSASFHPRASSSCLLPPAPCPMPKGSFPSPHVGGYMPLTPALSPVRGEGDGRRGRSSCSSPLPLGAERVGWGERQGAVVMGRALKICRKCGTC